MTRSLRCAALLAMMALVLIFASPVRSAAAGAVELCLSTVIPSLFPFFVLSSVFLRTGCGEMLGSLIAPAAATVLRLSPAGASALVLGLVGGYPVGARCTAELRNTSAISAEEAAHLAAFSNNAGPAFLLGFVGEGIFGSLRTGLWLWGIHVLSALLVGFLLRPRKKQQSRAGAAPRGGLGTAFLKTVPAAVMTLGTVCGYVVLFSCLTELWKLTPLHHPLFLGSWELTAGVTLLSPDRQGFLWAAILAGWGGTSVFCQSAALLRDAHVPLRRLLTGKLLQAAFSAILAAAVGQLLFA